GGGEFRALGPGAEIEPAIAAPAAYAERAWSPEEALVEIVRGRLEGSGPVAGDSIGASLALDRHQIATALAALEAEGFALRGHFSGSGAEEWCERRLLAAAHSYTVKRLRAEIEPVAARDLLRFLFEWQRVTADARMQGPDAVEVAVAQLEGFEAPAGAWETEILPMRVAEYEPPWLDDLCLAGRIAWARLRPRNGRAQPSQRSAAPAPTTPTTLLTRRHASLWWSLSPSVDAVP